MTDARVVVVHASPRVLLGSRSELLLIGISEALAAGGIPTVGQAGTLAELVRLVETRSPDVVIIDAAMPEFVDGAMLHLGARSGKWPGALILGDEADKALLAEALYSQPAARRRGVGFLYKRSPAARLVDSVRALSHGLIVLEADALPNDSSCSADSGYLREDLRSTVSAREYEILELVTRGMSNKEIAQALVLSEATVKGHVSRILVKLNLRSRTELAWYAMSRTQVRHDLLDASTPCGG